MYTADILLRLAGAQNNLPPFPILTLCRLEKSRGQRIIWLLEELNLDYEIKVFKRDANFRAQDDLKQVHPLGRSPMIGITPAGSDKEIVIAESETIMDYVCEHFGKHLIPKKWVEGKEGTLGGETEEWMRYKVCGYCWLTRKTLGLIQGSF